MSPCPPLIITRVCPWLINHLSHPWNFHKSNGILLRSNWRKPYPKFYGSELLIIKGWSRKPVRRYPPYLLGGGILYYTHHDLSQLTPWVLHLDELDGLALRLCPRIARARGALRQGGRGTQALGALGVVGDAPQTDLCYGWPVGTHMRTMVLEYESQHDCPTFKSPSD